MAQGRDILDISHNPDRDYALDKQGFPLYTETSEN
jgi:hypothetical protein